MHEKRKLALALAVIFILNIIIIMLVQEMPGTAVTYRRGATASAASQLQQRRGSRDLMITGLPNSVLK